MLYLEHLKFLEYLQVEHERWQNINCWCHLKNENNILQIKNLFEKIILYRSFSIVKMPAREVTIFPEKSKLVNFQLNCTKPKQHCIACIAECQTLEIIPQFSLIFNCKVFRLPPLHMQNAYSKQVLGMIILLVNRFLKFLRHFLRLLGCKKMTWPYFSCGFSEKRDYEKCRF